MPNLSSFSSDYYEFIGKKFDLKVANRLKNNALLQIVGQVDTTSQSYEIGTGEGFSELPQYISGDVALINPARGFKKVIFPKEQAGKYEISYKDWINNKNKDNIIAKCSTKLAEAAFMSVYLNTLDLFGNFINSSYLGGDGKTWGASDHPNAAKYDAGRADVADAASGTTSNLIQNSSGTYYNLTPAGIDAALVQGSKFMTPQGTPLLTNHRLVLVSPDLAPTARKLLGGDKEIGGVGSIIGGNAPQRDPGSAENAASSVAGLRWMVVGAGAGAGARGLRGKQWALCDPDMLKETALIVYNTRPKVMPEKSSTVLIDAYVAYVGCELGFGDWRGILFSNPS